MREVQASRRPFVSPFVHTHLLFTGCCGCCALRPRPPGPVPRHCQLNRNSVRPQHHSDLALHTQAAAAVPGTSSLSASSLRPPTSLPHTPGTTTFTHSRTRQTAPHLLLLSPLTTPQRYHPYHWKLATQHTRTRIILTHLTPTCRVVTPSPDPPIASPHRPPSPTCISRTHSRQHQQVPLLPTHRLGGPVFNSFKGKRKLPTLPPLPPLSCRTEGLCLVSLPLLLQPR